MQVKHVHRSNAFDQLRTKTAMPVILQIIYRIHIAYKIIVPIFLDILANEFISLLPASYTIGHEMRPGKLLTLGAHLLGAEACGRP